MPDYDYEEFDRRHEDDKFTQRDESKDGTESAKKADDKPEDIDW